MGLQVYFTSKLFVEHNDYDPNMTLSLFDGRFTMTIFSQRQYKGVNQ